MIFRTVLVFLVLSFGSAFAAGGGGGGDDSSSDALYKSSVSLIKRAGKLEKKDNKAKAEKLYSQAFKKLSKALKKDKKNPDILNYMGFTSRKIGNFSEAEDYYLRGLAIDPKHNGINEYLGELYVQTNRIDKANERLEVLKSCNCEEYGELELIIKTRGSKVY
jgi:tetratricopeptide (TPR) repeat protein